MNEIANDEPLPIAHFPANPLVPRLCVDFCSKWRYVTQRTTRILIYLFVWFPFTFVSQMGKK